MALSEARYSREHGRGKCGGIFLFSFVNLPAAIKFPSYCPVYPQWSLLKLCRPISCFRRVNVSAKLSIHKAVAGKSLHCPRFSPSAALRGLFGVVSPLALDAEAAASWRAIATPVNALLLAILFGDIKGVEWMGWRIMFQ